MQPIIERVIDLRKNQTPSENILWQILRNRKLGGWKFLRQYPIKVNYQGEIRFFIADFYCHKARLVTYILESEKVIIRNTVKRAGFIQNMSNNKTN